MRGDGRVFLRDSIYWCAFYVDGKEHRESTKKADKQQALKYLRSRMKELAVHELEAKPFITQRNRKLTVADLIEDLRTAYKVNGQNSPQNLSNLKRVEQDFGQHRALALTSAMVREYIQGRLEVGHAKASINRTTQLLAQSYKLAKLPAPEIQKLDESDNVRRGFFTATEIQNVMAHLPRELADFTQFGWLTGMRKSEIASLGWDDLDGDVIRLRAENAKNGTARIVPCEGQLAELIERRRLTRSYQESGTVRLSRLIFHRQGQPIREFRKSWATACRLAGVKRLFHDLRRSAVRDMVRAGVPQKDAMQISGHKTAAMFDRYSIRDEQDIRQALKRREQFIRETQPDNVIQMAGGWAN
jgi:integrase